MERPLRLLTPLILLALGIGVQAQTPPSIQDAAAYDAWKSQFALPGSTVPGHPPMAASGQRDDDTCTCWMAPDASYTTIDNTDQWDAGGFGNGDDGSFGPLALPFTFTLYGQVFDTVFININGNISFQMPYSTFSASAFPTEYFTMIAPFWADVDLRGPGEGLNVVQYKITPTAFFVNWSNVGYFTQHVDKLNSFQLIISDGTDPAIPGGNNVSFCYGDMTWTTGDASSGVEGFGGIPATVGANRGNGEDFIQFGQFDHDGTDYDGAYDASDGVAWLSDRHFVFSTASEEIPPIFTNTSCDTLVIDVGSSFDFPMMILAGGPGQTVTASALSPTFSNFTTTLNATGDGQTTLQLSLAPQGEDVGDHVITLTAETGSTPPLSSTYTLHLKVLPATGIAATAGEAGFALSPNPAAGQALLRWPAGQTPVRVEVLAPDGKRVLDAVPDQGSVQMVIRLEGLPDGTYAVRTTGAAGAHTQRLVYHRAR
jgi:hypothetical protein